MIRSLRMQLISTRRNLTKSETNSTTATALKCTKTFLSSRASPRTASLPRTESSTSSLSRVGRMMRMRIIWNLPKFRRTYKRSPSTQQNTPTTWKATS